MQKKLNIIGVLMAAYVFLQQLDSLLDYIAGADVSTGRIVMRVLALAGWVIIFCSFIYQIYYGNKQHSS